MARGATSILHHAKSVRRQPTFSPLDKSRRVFLFAFLSLIVLASTCAIFYIGTHIQAVNLGYNIGQELQRKESLIEENKRLSLEIARLKSPTRIETEAKETLGLELPKTQQVFYLSRLESDTLVRVAGAKPLAEPEAGKPAPAGDGPAAAVAGKGETKPAKPSPPAAPGKVPANDAPAVARSEPKPNDDLPAKPATKSLAAPTLAQQDKILKKSPAAAEPAAKPERTASANPTVATKSPAKALQAKPAEAAAPKAVAKRDKVAEKSQAAEAAAAKPTAPVLAQQDKALKKSDAPKTGPAPADTAKPPRPQAVASAKTGSPAKPGTVPVEAAKPRNATANPTVATKALQAKPAEPEAPKVVAQKDKDAAPAKKAEGGKNATAKNELGKTAAPKSSAKEKSPELRVAKGEDTDVLVAKIVAREPTREKGRLKTGPSLAYQPKDKVPAVMLDPMP